ncbi:GH36 C-terminal domain-containing protein [Enterococcus timonensis]|uniref:GH36 C-terminal domain-containing protein n=1 Tax=Enterococcus timonensis TaxID=1852364 RepID=UPI0038B3ADA4
MLELAGLSQNTLYETEQGAIYSGEELMTLGFYMDYYLPGDYASKKIYLKKVGRK